MCTIKPTQNASTAIQPLFLACILMMLTLMTYWPVSGHQFVNYDDDLYVTENHRVQSGLTWKNMAWAFSSLEASNWHPMTWLSHMLDCELFGVNPKAHHLTSLFFHVTNTILLFFLFKGMTQALWKSAFLAALFALHPLHVESVAWVAERKDVLSTFFWILTTGAYGWYVRKSRIPRYLLVLVLFALGLMAKPMLVTLPFVLLLLDYWPLGRLNTESRQRKHALKAFFPLLKEKWVLFLLAAASSFMTLHAQSQGPAVQSLENIPILIRIANALVSACTYITMTFWPSRLSVYYPHPLNALPLWKIAVSALLILAVTGFVLHKRKGRPYLLVGWFWYLGTLFPVIGLVQVGGQAMADRYTYIPLIGLFIMVTWGVSNLVEEKALLRKTSSVTAVVVLLILTVCTRTQVGQWKDSEMLFRQALLVTSKNQLAHNQLGFALYEKGKLDESISQYKKAIDITPQYVDAHVNLGNAYKDKGRLNEAILQYRKALSYAPNHAVATNNLGIVLAMQGNMRAAAALFSRVLKIDPGNFRAHNNLGIVWARQGQFEKAIFHFSEALKINPLSASARENLQRALNVKGGQ